jgi:group I intron endonuclease
MGYIYILTSPTGKIYIGQTTRPIHKRLEEHETGQSISLRGISGAIKKYGWENFEIDWYECVDDDLNKHERWLVTLMGTLSPNGYNLREGGGSRGKHSEESKQKNRESNSGKNSYWFGKKQNEEHRQKRREAQLGENNHRWGSKRSKETKQKHSESIKGDKNHNSKRVYQYNLDGIFIASFGSTGEAERNLEKNGSSIRACACGKRNTAYKFKWSYTPPFI